MSARRAADEILPRIAAALATAALLLLVWRALMHVPDRRADPAPAGERLQLRFVERMSPRTVQDIAATPPAEDAGVAVDRDARTRPVAATSAIRTDRAVAAADTATADTGGRLVLYDADGRALLPADDRFADGRRPRATDADTARRLLERENPVDYRGTRFARDWVSDGDVADVAQQEIARAQKKIARLIYGPDIQHAEARPSPDVRFNPGRHERPSDLGSEATGDAYKAAPISDEKAPGLEGEASRRIRTQVAALERRAGGCDRARIERLMEPLLQHLGDLQKAEAAFARGADPIRAAHMLPNQADAAYNGARRALWHAERQLAGCLR